MDVEEVADPFLLKQLFSDCVFYSSKACVNNSVRANVKHVIEWMEQSHLSYVPSINQQYTLTTRRCWMFCGIYVVVINRVCELQFNLLSFLY